MSLQSLQPDVIAVYILNEMVSSLCDFVPAFAAFLEVLKQHSILAVLGSLLGEHLHSVTDLDLMSAIFGFFISLSSHHKVSLFRSSVLI